MLCILYIARCIMYIIFLFCIVWRLSIICYLYWSLDHNHQGNVLMCSSPLTEELKIVWDLWVKNMFFTKSNISNASTFVMDINDFPIYVMISGWSAKGKLVCLCWNCKNTNFTYLRNIYSEDLLYRPSFYCQWIKNKSQTQEILNGKVI